MRLEVFVFLELQHLIVDAGEQIDEFVIVTGLTNVESEETLGEDGQRVLKAFVVSLLLLPSGETTVHTHRNIIKHPQ